VISRDFLEKGERREDFEKELRVDEVLFSSFLGSIESYEAKMNSGERIHAPRKPSAAQPTRS
jgi:hypothetical protein